MESPSQLSYVTCVKCDEEGPASRRFCGKCGQLLWEPCIACGEKNPVDERFCGKCGTDLHEKLKAVQQELTEAVSKSDEQARQGRFLDAVEQLQEQVIPDHSQLKHLAEQIAERIETFPQRREQAIEVSNRVVGEAQELIAEQRYPQAHERLTNVPPAFRNQEISTLLVEVASKVEEAQGLRKLVKQALQERNYDALLPQVKRLVELDGDDKQIRNLLSQLQQREQKKTLQESTQLIKIAKGALAKCDYKRAEAALQKLPDVSESDAKTAKTVLLLKECVWLAEQLRTEPFISPTLCMIAERLLKLQPHDQRHAEISKQLQARWRKATREKNQGPIPWAKSPQESSLGVPLAPLRLPAELLGAEKSASCPPQSMSIAFGLALQGLGKASIMTDLAPKEKKGTWLKRLKLRESKQTHQSAWGIDIGARNLKALRLVTDEQGEKIRVAESVVLPLASPNGTGPDDVDPLAEVTQRFLKQHDLTQQVVVLNLPGTQTLGRFFDIPAPNPEKFLEAVEYEMGARIPLEVDQSLFDYHWSELTTATEDAPPQRRVALVAANKKHVESRLQLFDTAGAARLAVQSGCIALGNTVRHVQGPSAKCDGVAVLEIGAETSTFTVLKDSNLWFRGLYLGANAFDKAISNGLSKKICEAELLRSKPEKAAVMHQVHELLLPVFATFAEELQRSLNRYESETCQPVSQLFLCGAGSEQFGLLRFLQSTN
ncbi:MAG: pilus assembly protein PilM [Pirellulales bacterium]|nr:pilus assembly protein PilM [Pirellulales bacterium]